MPFPHALLVRKTSFFCVYLSSFPNVSGVTKHKENPTIMICTTQQQADRVAFFGARKMTAQGYTRTRLQAFLPTGVQFAFRIVKPDGTRYTVNIGDKPTCSCAFFKENQKWAVCKHIVFGRQERDADVAEEEYQKYENARLEELEARAAERAEGLKIAAEEFGDACERYAMHSA